MEKQHEEDIKKRKKKKKKNQKGSLKHVALHTERGKKNSISSYAFFMLFKYLHINRSKSTNCCYAVLNLGILLNSHIC